MLHGSDQKTVASLHILPELHLHVHFKTVSLKNLISIQNYLPFGSCPLYDVKTYNQTSLIFCSEVNTLQNFELNYTILTLALISWYPCDITCLIIHICHLNAIIVSMCNSLHVTNFPLYSALFWLLLWSYFHKCFIHAHCPGT